MQKDFTQGSILRHLLGMGAFIGAGMVFQTAYFLVDLYFVSRLGPASIAGVSAAGNVFFLVMGLVQLISVGAMALISQSIGAKTQEDANTLSNQAMSLALAFGAAAFVLIALFGQRGVAILSADAETARAAWGYLGAFAPGLALMFPNAALGASLRAAGVVGPPMVVQTLSVLVNIALAPVLITGWLTGAPLGAAGAGWASTAAASVGFIALLLLFPRVQTMMRYTWEAMRPKTNHWARIAGVGLPSTGEFFLMFVVTAVVYWVIRGFGQDAQAGFGVAGRVTQSLFMPIMAISFAAGPIVGQNFGAKNSARVKETFRQSALICATLMGTLTLVAQVGLGPVLRVFTSEPRALEVADDYLRVASWNFVASGLVFTCSSVFQGLGDTRPALLASASRLVTFVAPALWLANSPSLTLHKVWLVSVVSVYAQMLISLWLLRRKLRRSLGSPLSPSLAPSA